MAIEDLLSEATDIKHERGGVELHSDVLESRVPLLLDFYRRGLPDAEKATFDALDPMDRITRLREKNYKLKPELADEMIRYLAVKILKRHDETLGNQLEADFNIVYKTPGATPEAKSAAIRRIRMFQPMLENIGFNMTGMEETAKQRGFTQQFWTQFIQAIPQRYIELREEAVTELIPEAEAHAYLAGTVVPATGIKQDLVKARGLREVRSVLADYFKTQRRGDVTAFTQQYAQYH